MRLIRYENVLRSNALFFPLLIILISFVSRMASAVPPGLVTIPQDRIGGGTGASLREAIASVDPGDTVTFDGSLDGQTLTLTLGELVIDKPMTIQGLGARNLTISGGDTFRIFKLTHTSGVVMIQDLTLANARKGGTSLVDEKGGAIQNHSGHELLVQRCTLRNDRSDFGGGISSEGSGTVTSIENCTFDVDRGDQSQRTFGYGGGFYNGAGSQAYLRNCTFDTCATAGGGGAIANVGAKMTVLNCTITKSYIYAADGSGGAGGIFTQAPTGDFKIGNTIVSANVDANHPTENEFKTTAPVVSLGGNYISKVSSDAGFTNGVNSDQVTLSPASSGSPVSSTLANNGGPTDTHTVNPGSSVIDRGLQSLLTFDNFPNGFDDDQRGPGFPIHGVVDIGAVEFDPVDIIVNTATDENDGIGAGGISLRDAIAAANSDSTITFDAALEGSSFLLTHGGLTINKPLNIIGPGADIMDIDGDDVYRVFQLTHSAGQVFISGMTIHGGSTSGDGGGILVSGNGSLYLQDCNVRDNAATNGGGLAIVPNDLTDFVIERCAIYNNTASASGGGISAGGDEGLLTNSTVSGNSAGAGLGGGIAENSNDGLTIVACAVTQNLTGGGIRSLRFIGLGNTIIEANDGALEHQYNQVNADNEINSFGGNYVSDSYANSGINIGNGDQVGTDADPLPAVLDPVLSFNGGPTASHELIFPSGAIGSANPALLGIGFFPGGFDVDQRGNARVFNHLDVGPVEAYPQGIIVNVDDDRNNDSDFGGVVSVREAITEIAPGGVIEVRPNAPQHSIFLDLGELHVSKPMEIHGNGHTIDAQSLSRVFQIDSGGTHVIMLHLGIQHGATDEGGGGIINLGGDLFLSQCTIDSNIGFNGGGLGLYNRARTYISECAITNNTANGAGGFSGGIDNYTSSSLTLVNSTVAKNTATFGGGVLSEDAYAGILNCTIMQNTSSENNGGGFVAFGSGMAEVQNTIIQLNTSATNHERDDLSFDNNVQTSIGGNYIGIAYPESGFENGTSGDVAGTMEEPLPAAVDTNLAFNGGPTMTYYPLHPGPAIDTANPILLGDDQRGSIRPFGESHDKGAVEWAPFVLDGISDSIDCEQENGLFITESEGYLYVGLTKDTTNDIYIFLSHLPGELTPVLGTDFSVAAWDYLIVASPSSNTFAAYNANYDAVNFNVPVVPIVEDGNHLVGLETAFPKDLVGGRRTFVSVVEAGIGGNRTIIHQFPAGAGPNVEATEFLPVITGYDSCTTDLANLRSAIVDQLLGINVRSTPSISRDANDDGVIDAADVKYVEK